MAGNSGNYSADVEWGSTPWLPKDYDDGWGPNEKVETFFPIRED